MNTYDIQEEIDAVYVQIVISSRVDPSSIIGRKSCSHCIVDNLYRYFMYWIDEESAASKQIEANGATRLNLMYDPTR
jgi:hypothetical protein